MVSVLERRFAIAVKANAEGSIPSERTFHSAGGGINDQERIGMHRLATFGLIALRDWLDGDFKAPLLGQG